MWRFTRSSEGDTLENFAKAIRNVLMRFKDREMNVVEIDEIWIETSIPKDFIIELIKKGEVEVPEGIDEIRKGKSVIWRRER